MVAGEVLQPKCCFVYKARLSEGNWIKPWNPLLVYHDASLIKELITEAKLRTISVFPVSVSWHINEIDYFQNWHETKALALVNIVTKLMNS